MAKLNGAKDGRPFKKGQSGNPNGRPKKLPDLDKLGAEMFGADSDTAPSRIMEVLESMFNQAKKGNTQAATILLDRFYGKPTQKTELTGKDGDPLAGSFIIEVPKTD